MSLGEAKRIERTCEQCGAKFLPASWCSRTCSDACRRSRKKSLDVARVKTRARPASIELTLAARHRNATWCAANRACEKQNQWLAGAPPYHTHLPGVATTLAVHPLPRWPIELRNTPGLHGALTNVLATPHRPRFPNFALIPWQAGWSVYWFHEDGGRLPNQHFNGALFDVPTVFSLGPPVRFRAPQVVRRGRQRVRLDIITPVIIRATDRGPLGGRPPCVRPTAANLISAIGAELPHRLMPDPHRVPESQHWVEYVRDRVRLEIVETHTEPAYVPFGGKYEPVKGFQGHVIVEVNAVARWLLEVAARMGLGGRTAFGCGRIRITEVE